MKSCRILAVLLSLLLALNTGYAQHSTASYVQVVNQATPGQGGISAVTVSSSGSPSNYTIPVTFTAAVPSGATGTITFKDGTNALGTVAITGTTATLTTSTLTVGTHSITGSYSGDSNFVAVSSAAISQVVNTADSVTRLAINSSPAMLGTPVTFTAQISTGGMAATGLNISFYDGATSVGAGSVSPSNTTNLLLYSNNLTAASWSTNQATVGATAQGPTTNTQASTFTSNGANGYIVQTVSGLTASAPMTFSAWMRVPSGTQSVPLTITNTSNTPLASQSCPASSTWTRCSVTATTGAGMTSAKVLIGGVGNGIQVQLWGEQVEEAATPGPYVQTDGTALAGSGATASFTTSNLPAGTHTITAQYAGDPSVGASTSEPETLIITEDSSTHVTLASGTNPSTYGQSVTFTATVTPVSAITPTGSITFNDGATPIGTGTLSNGSVQFSTSALTAGSHSITAVYSGDTDYDDATSSPVSQTVNQAAGTLSVASSGSPSAFGTSVTFTATVPSDATGTVTFKDGSTTIGTGTITGGVASLTTNALTAGTHTITASWPGDNNYSSPANATVTQIVNTVIANMAISGIPNPSTYGTTVTITVTMTGVIGVTPTGTVSISDGATVLNAAVSIDGSGNATFTTSALGAGSHNITATYSGDNNYN